MLKTAFYSSYLYKAIVFAGNTYESSGTRAFFEKLGVYASESAIGRCYERFKNKKPAVDNSYYQKALDKISGLISAVTEKLHLFFKKAVEGSAFCRAYFGFIGNSAENKLRGVGIFGFYFCVALAGVSIFMPAPYSLSFSAFAGITAFGGSAAIFAVGIVFFVITMLSGKITRVFNNSFFVRLIKDLLK